MKVKDTDKAIAYQTLTNFGGLIIISIDDEYVISAFDYGDGIINKSRSKLYITTKGDVYFRKYHVRYNLSEIMRVAN